VALVCYSRGLARYLQLQAQAWKDRPAFVGTFHQLALDWGVEPGTGSEYFEEQVPEGLRAAAAGRADLFDAVVVDEAQDFGALWWPAMTACLRTDEGVFAFLDEGQRVFERQGAAPVHSQPYPLRRNYRNTKRIAQTFGSLGSEAAKYDGRTGTRVRYVECSTEEVLSRADDAVDALLSTWEPHQVALLTTKHRHPVHADKVTTDGDDAYWDDFFAEDDVFYGSVSGFKGLERTCIVLAVNGFSAQARAKQMLYVGLSRARSQLVVVGDLDEIAPAGERGGVRQRLLDARGVAAARLTTPGRSWPTRTSSGHSPQVSSVRSPRAVGTLHSRTGVRARGPVARALSRGPSRRRTPAGRPAPGKPARPRWSRSHRDP
jgi:hypothetical protein